MTGTAADIRAARRRRSENPSTRDDTVTDDQRPKSGPSELPAVRTVRLSDVTPERVEWLWQGRIPRGMLTLVDGDPGLGKSTMTLDIAARVSRGAPMPFDGRGAMSAADVLLMSAEDHLAATILPRLNAAGADTARIHALVAMPRKGDPEAAPTLAPDDVERLEATIGAHRAALVVIDPLMAHVPADVDSHKDQDVRRILRPLAVAAEHTGAAIVIVRHLRKGIGSALYRGGGSIGIAGAARSVLLVAPEPPADDAAGRNADTGVRIVAPVKSNLARPAAALRWRLVDSLEHGTARIEWIDVATGITADALAAPFEPKAPEDGSLVERAAAAVRDVLADGPRPVKEVERLVRELTGASATTFKRARAKVGVIAEQVRGEAGQIERVELRLPASGPPATDGPLDDDEDVTSPESQGVPADAPEGHGQRATDAWPTGQEDEAAVRQTSWTWGGTP